MKTTKFVTLSNYIEGLLILYLGVISFSINHWLNDGVKEITSSEELMDSMLEKWNQITTIILIFAFLKLTKAIINDKEKEDLEWVDFLLPFILVFFGIFFSILIL